MSPAPARFDGTLEELAREHILPNMPAPEPVALIHRRLTAYLSTDDPLFLVRYVRDMERRETYRVACGCRLRATDNSPAWWMHYHSLAETIPDDGGFGRFVEEAPCHMFDVARSVPTTAAANGWHIAHILSAKDGNVDYVNWGRDELAKRFVRSIHPCNWFLFPMSVRGLAETPGVIDYMAGLWSTRYSAVWSEFLDLAQGAESGEGGPLRVAYSDRVEAPAGLPVLASESASVSYRYRRFAFIARYIEPLAWDDCFQVETPAGTFRMTKRQFYDGFPGVISSRSYREGGIYHYPKITASVERFRVEA